MSTTFTNKLALTDQEQMLIEKAHEYYNSSDYISARAYILRAIEENAKNPEAYILNGLIKAEQAELEDAIVDFDNAIMNSMSWSIVKANAFYQRGRIKYFIGDLYEAMSDLMRSIELQPNFASNYYYCGKIRLQLDDYSGAIKDFGKAIEKNPNDPYAYFFRAEARATEAGFVEAIEDYTKSLDLFPRNDSTMFREKSLSKGLIFHSRGMANFYICNTEDAIEDFNAAIEFNSMSASSYTFRGNSQCELGNIKEAISDWEKAIKLGYKGCIEWNI